MVDKAQLEIFTTHLQKVNRYLRCKTFDNKERIVTRVQWLLLRYLYRKPDRTIGQLAAHLDVRQSTMSQMLDRLEKVDLIMRRTDSQDARIKLVELTAAGILFIRQTEEAWMEALAEPFAHFTPDERQALVDLMEKLSQHLPKEYN
ncbi:MarR family transcriptional regulator [Paenibacillus psychroresistens]|uniref:MarR family transcriptional regulator n=1 Tax=Paenibacillus psychroresistens TaxID=1778678 RepID=A0A6B8RET2_9BACL|nr:MarR family transcriptional regulator [Paenibacillus psychroresistens]QGQ94065.1 MarR family transcriptional regulator [Paenibacillus psychroresistens]